jgi:uncharacterized protein YbjQ (UPF0145 family)
VTESAGLPEAARRRLEELRGRGGRFFTSDLTTPEFLLVREGGFRPLTQVMGSCFYHVGYQWMPTAWTSYAEGQTLELDTQTEAWNEARGLALARLAEEARLAGAAAVVGVRIERGAYDWAAGLIEFVATGTAVASDRYDLGEEPVLSSLSGQEFAALFRHGYWPAGLVGGSTVCYVMTGWQQNWRSTGFLSSMQNQELPDFTQGLYDAREQALRLVTGQGHELHAHGIVGVRLDTAVHEHEREQGGARYTDLIVTMHVLGTAIVELAQAGDEPSVYIALRLDQETR